uniref:Uncharacterized protein n=1 Tax=CrAss-like virus sp. ctYsL76 TaxID=2826826 RepID=A0A8S5QLM2_9CAUD|nr:MAG TPA: hypothetical protein [CrAss-like virus sp. ctYsL76]
MELSEQVRYMVVKVLLKEHLMYINNYLCDLRQ